MQIGLCHSCIQNDFSLHLGKTLVFNNSKLAPVYSSLSMSYHFPSLPFNSLSAPLVFLQFFRCMYFFPTQGPLHRLSLYLECSSLNYLPIITFYFFRSQQSFPKEALLHPSVSHPLLYSPIAHSEFFFRMLIFICISIFTFMILSLISAS